MAFPANTAIRDCQNERLNSRIAAGRPAAACVRTQHFRFDILRRKFSIHPITVRQDEPRTLGTLAGPRGSQCRVASCICALDSRDRVSVTWPAFAPSETLPQARLRDHRHTGRRRTFAEPVAALAECVKLDAYAKLICQQNSHQKSSTPLSLDLRNRSGTSTHRSVNYGRCCPVAARKQPPRRKLRNANGER